MPTAHDLICSTGACSWGHDPLTRALGKSQQMGMHFDFEFIPSSLPHHTVDQECAHGEQHATRA